MFLLRQQLNLQRTLSKIARKFSSGSLSSVSIDDNGIATLTLQRPPVNGLNAALLTELSTTLTELEKNKTRGLILTSSLNSVFSGGLDLLEMYKPDKDRATRFWTALQDTWLKLYGSSFPTVAAINGHSPAGGCLLAMSCEYRVMVKGYSIGLNETALGIIAPPWFMATMRNTISRRDAELALTSGRLFTTEEALKINLIDEIAEDRDDALQKSQHFLNKFAKIPSMARSLTKKALREKDLKDLASNRTKDLELFLSVISQDKVQQGLELYLKSLQKKKA